MTRPGVFLRILFLLAHTVLAQFTFSPTPPPISGQSFLITWVAGSGDVGIWLNDYVLDGSVPLPTTRSEITASTPNNGSYLWQVPNGLCGLHSFSFGMNFQAINNYSPEFTIPCPSSSVWIPSTTYTGPSQQIATQTISAPGWNSFEPSTPTLQCITSPGAGFELCVQYVASSTPPPQTVTTFLPLSASSTINGATTPTFPVTAFSSGYFSSQLGISECPTSIYPAPTAFVDANGTTTSFLSAGCSASFSAPGTQGITDFGATCHAGQNTLSYNGVVTAADRQMENEIICCPGNGVWYQTILTKTSGDVRTAPPSAVEGYYCFSYLITLTYSPTTTISPTGSIYVDTGYPKRAVPVTTTAAALAKRQDYPGFASGFGAGATGTVVVINDVVFVRAATISSTSDPASTSNPATPTNLASSAFSPSSVPHTITAPAVGAYPIIAATTFAPGYFASILAASACPTSMTPTATAVVGGDSMTTSFLTIGCATSGSSASTTLAATCPSGLRPLTATAAGQCGACCPSGAWSTTSIGTSSTGLFCYSSIVAPSSSPAAAATSTISINYSSINGPLTALAPRAEVEPAKEKRQASSASTASASGDVVVLNDVLFVKAVMLASASGGSSSTTGGAGATATSSAAGTSASAKSGAVGRAERRELLMGLFLLLCSLAVFGT